MTGRPGAGSPATDRAGARRRLGYRGAGGLRAVFGGSLGAGSINRRRSRGSRDAPFRVLHIAGARDFAALRERPVGPRYDLREYLPIEQFRQALVACDLVVAARGGSIFEVAAHGRPAILVPYPDATADHQATNARWMQEGGAAVVVADDQLDGPRLAREVGALLADRGRLSAMAHASAAPRAPRAAREVAEELLAAAGPAERARVTIAARLAQQPLDEQHVEPLAAQAPWRW